LRVQAQARVEGDPTARRPLRSRPRTSFAGAQPASLPTFRRELGFAPTIRRSLQSECDRPTPATNARAVRPRPAVDSRGRPLAVSWPKAGHERARCRPTRQTGLLRQTQQRPLTAQQRSPARAWRPRRSRLESSSRPRWPARQLARPWRRGSRAQPAPRPPAAPRAELPAPRAGARARAGRRNPVRRS
jgi:hypothetical protein